MVSNNTCIYFFKSLKGTTKLYRWFYKFQTRAPVWISSMQNFTICTTIVKMTDSIFQAELPRDLVSSSCPIDWGLILHRCCTRQNIPYAIVLAGITSIMIYSMLSSIIKITLAICAGDEIYSNRMLPT
jgi:hypothetical protein